MSGDTGSGGLDIRSGGIVAVDTASLEEAAARLSDASDDLVGIGRLLRDAATQLTSVGHLVGGSAAGRAWALADAAEHRSHTASALADRLRRSAAVYEAVELRAARAAAEAAGDTSAIQRIDDRLAAIEVAHPGAGLWAWAREMWRDVTWPADIVGRFTEPAWWFGPATGATAAFALWGLAGSMRALHSGMIPRHARLRGAAEPVLVTAVAQSGPVAAPVATASGALVAPAALPPPTAPASLAAVAERIPATGAARVRVERYTMPDGSRQFAVYIAGTRSSDIGGEDPFDGLSDLELAAGGRSSSYDAVLTALADSGAQPGDVVRAFGYSQGAMIAAHLAVEGGYDTQTLVTFGSPVDADLGDGTLSVAVRHSDDPVAALAAGGRSDQAGAAGSIVAERSAVSGHQLDPLAAHHLEAYTETAQMLDASDDPRMDGVRAVFAELGDAASVEVTEYSAERVSPSAGGAG